MNKLRYNFFNLEEIFKEILDREDINIYGYTVKKDNVHLVYLLKNGDLNYGIYSNGNWTVAQIGKFDVRSNKYNQFELLYIKDMLHIFYSYSNLINSNISTIHHVVYKENIESRFNVIRYISKKTNSYFAVDNDSNGNIHLLYNTIVNDMSHIYYTYFNPFTSSWLNNPVMMSESEKHSINPFMFVDSNDNLHSIWWEKSSDSYVLKYKRKSLFGRERFKWLVISSLKVDSVIPEVFLTQDNESLHLIYGDMQNFSVITSMDYGLNWSPSDEKLEIMDRNIALLVNIKDVTKDDNMIINPNDFIEDNILDEGSLEEQINITEVIEEVINNLEFKEAEQILYNQAELKIQLNNIMDEVIYIKSKITELESNQKESLIKRLFN